MKSKVRIFALMLSGIAVVGVAQAFDYVPWQVSSPIKVGIFATIFAIFAILKLPCERCNVSSVSAVLDMKDLGVEERKVKTAELKKSGYRTAAFKKHCPFCDMERY